MTDLNGLLKETHICSYPHNDPTARTWHKLGVPGQRFTSFRLIGRAEVFGGGQGGVAFGECAGIACVRGVTADGKYMTTARVVDVIPLD